MTGNEATDQLARHLMTAAGILKATESVYIRAVIDLGPRALEVTFNDGTTAVVTVNVE